MEDKKDSHKVHFEVNKDVTEKDNEIVIENSSEQQFVIHLGFLQFYHKYSVEFSISKSCFVSPDSKAKPICTDTERPHLKILNVTASCDKIIFQLELFAYKEKLMVEEFILKFSDKDVFSVVLKARILGKGKGTPLLKNGIHVIEHPVDSDSSSE